MDFFEQLKEWGFDLSEFKATEFDVVDLIHPDDVVTQATTPSVAYRIVERGTSDHTIDQGFKRQALAAGAQIHYKSRVKEEDCTIIACGPKGTSAVRRGNREDAGMARGRSRTITRPPGQPAAATVPFAVEGQGTETITLAVPMID